MKYLKKLTELFESNLTYDMKYVYVDDLVYSNFSNNIFDDFSLFMIYKKEDFCDGERSCLIAMHLNIYKTFTLLRSIKKKVYGYEEKMLSISDFYEKYPELVYNLYDDAINKNKKYADEVISFFDFDNELPELVKKWNRNQLKNKYKI